MGVLPGVPARGADSRCEHGNCLHQSDSAPQMPGKLTKKKTTSVVFSVGIRILKIAHGIRLFPTFSPIRILDRQGIFITSFQLSYIPYLPYNKRISNRNCDFFLVILVESAGKVNSVVIQHMKDEPSFGFTSTRIRNIVLNDFLLSLYYLRPTSGETASIISLTLFFTV